MPTNKHLTDLIINKVESQAVYDYMIANNLINDDELYLVGGESAAVLYTPQTLTDEQKEQARANIGAISVADIPEVPVTSVAGKTGAVTLTKGDVGLGNVTNESKATMFTSPAFTGTPTAPTANKGTNTTQVATTAFVATAMGDKANTSTTISAGNGLSGGGSLEANRTISVKAGTGIAVDANGVHNAGVRSVTQDTADGHKLTINTNGTNTTVTIPDKDTTYTAGTGLTLNGTQFNHSNTVAAGSVSGSSGTTTYGDTISIPKITYDAQGHITKAETTSITLPAKITASDLGLEQAMRFLGTLDDTDDNAIFDGYTNASVVIGGKTITAELGNVVLYNGKEYVYSSNGWEELGDEGSHALKSITITAENGLTGGGDLSANRTISAKAGTGITVDNNGIHNAGVRSITQDSTDGHKLTINTGGTNTTITIPDNDTTYSEATTSAAGLMSAADKTFVDGAQAQIDGKMNATNPTGSGTFSLGRLEGSTVGAGSIAMGFNTTASGYYSHAEGERTTASNRASHAEGGRTTASGYYSHAEGENTTTTASARYSHAEGGYTTASGWGSHAEGYHTTASSDYQHAQGMYNIADTISAHIVGNGGYDENVGEEVYSNAHTLDWDGNAWFAGDVYVGSTSGTNKDEGSVKLATVAEMPTIEIVRW